MIARRCDRQGAVNEPDMGECLREIAERFTGFGVNLLGEQSEIV
jgi:hypothetical protein